MTKKVNAVGAYRMSAQEKQWRAQEDARTLMAAEQIKRDRDRVSGVKVVAKQMQQALGKATPKRPTGNKRGK